MRRMNLKLAHCSQHSDKTIQGTDAEGELLGLLAWDIFYFIIILLLTHWRPHPFREGQLVNALIESRGLSEKQQENWEEPAFSL